ncbi:MAG: DNA helicase UvrD [candidate division Zixibacteria bacterium SM23_73_3]|nr:MAG: DNA helicase UvrD [candidate division Zixibacteria bacterium SM23_73_3]
MEFIADFHVHSKYSRATSKEMDVENMARWASLKGVGLLGTGDFTHPFYFAELKQKLQPTGSGLFILKKEFKKSTGNSSQNEVQFMLTTEVSNMFQQGESGRRVHTMIFAPSFEVVEKINEELSQYGKLGSDGRPIFGFPTKELVEIITDITDECFIVPAHAWTPWFSVFGANSGFDSIEECFEEQTKHISCIETGLSSDPQMNWRFSALDKIALISNSDAHSPNRIGREANVFDCEKGYKEIIKAIRTRDQNKFLSTIEFFPEEGKYHYDGHRNCGILFSPSESRKNKNICPVCGRKLTVGVMHRVESLADRPAGFIPEGAIPCKHLIPLQEIIAEALNQGVDTKGVQNEYLRLVSIFGSEFRILLDLSLEELEKSTPPKILEGIKRVREGDLQITPGHDGVYGKIQIFAEKEKEPTEQLGLF